MKRNLRIGHQIEFCDEDEKPEDFPYLIGARCLWIFDKISLNEILLSALRL